MHRSKKNIYKAKTVQTVLNKYVGGYVMRGSVDYGLVFWLFSLQDIN